MDDSTANTPDTAVSTRWRRSPEVGRQARTFDPESTPLPHPANEVERILREYACECYSVGRGESMYYLVEDLPRIARAATREIMAIQPGQGGALASEPLTRSEARLKLRRLASPQRRGNVAKGAKSAVAVLPVVAILAVLVLALGMAFKDAIATVLGG